MKPGNQREGAEREGGGREGTQGKPGNHAASGIIIITAFNVL